LIYLEGALSELLARMDPSEAATILVEAFGRGTDSGANSIFWWENAMAGPAPGERLAPALSASSSRMGPSEAGRIFGPAAQTPTDALGGENNVGACHSLALALSELSARLDSSEATRICGPAAKALADALGRENDAFARHSLATALREVSGRLDPSEAARICSP